MEAIRRGYGRVEMGIYALSQAVKNKTLLEVELSIFIYKGSADNHRQTIHHPAVNNKFDVALIRRWGSELSFKARLI